MAGLFSNKKTSIALRHQSHFPVSTAVRSPVSVQLPMALVSRPPSLKSSPPGEDFSNRAGFGSDGHGANPVADFPKQRRRILPLLGGEGRGEDGR